MCPGTQAGRTRAPPRPGRRGASTGMNVVDSPGMTRPSRPSSSSGQPHFHHVRTEPTQHRCVLAEVSARREHRSVAAPSVEMVSPHGVRPRPARAFCLGHLGIADFGGGSSRSHGGSLHRRRHGQPKTAGFVVLLIGFEPAELTPRRPFFGIGLSAAGAGGAPAWPPSTALPAVGTMQHRFLIARGAVVPFAI